MKTTTKENNLFSISKYIALTLFFLDKTFYIYIYIYIYIVIALAISIAITLAIAYAMNTAHHKEATYAKY